MDGRTDFRVSSSGSAAAFGRFRLTMVTPTPMEVTVSRREKYERHFAFPE
jgi:hypothetical protein